MLWSGSISKRVLKFSSVSLRSRIVLSSPKYFSIMTESKSALPTQSREFVERRLKLWDELEKKQPRGAFSPIVVTLPDGKTVDAESWKTTPLEIAKQISIGLAKKVVVAKVNGAYHDLMRPLEGNCKLQLFTFDTPEGKHAFWHSSAHLLGRALEAEFGAKLCMGPPLEDGGFYYDCQLDAQGSISPDQYAQLETHINQMIKEKHPFVRITLSKEDAKELFKDNPFKLQIIQDKVKDGEFCSAYRSGPLIDLCKGPHLPNTGYITAMMLTKSSSAYWLGKDTNASLQRVYGISYPDKKQLKEYQDFMELAAQRDHRRLGTEQKLFIFHDVSPGSCFFLPHGARIYNKLCDFIRSEYRKRGFDEVISPNVFNVDLWKTSGHYENYKENMFLFQVEGQEFGMKPMNCPGHCMMFKSQLHSYRELPIRFADFGALHRNEASGALTGLTRVRRFQQDDAHIFCRHDQIEQEINGALDFLKFVYAKFGFKFALALSTRPEKYLGSIQQWDEAEQALARCLTKFGSEWQIKQGDGAFYGPKIDILLTDALHRKHQCATIQLDFQLPRRFELKYKGEDGQFHTPVMVHRAILGSVERMFAVLLEHTGGKWPFWLSPRQACVVPVAPEFNAYAQDVQKRLWDADFYVDVDDSNDQFKKKIREAQIHQYNYILVVGQKESEAGSANVRSGRDNAVLGERTIDQIIEDFRGYKRDFL